jgi:hypothetical protein
LKVWVKSVHVPPYRLVADRKFWPECAMVRMAAVMAACPEAKASPPMPPSSAARRFSSTSLVGFISRE